MVKYLLGQLAGHRFADKTLDNFVWTDDNKHLKEFFYDIVELEVWERGIGLVGDVGVGKTHILSALYKNRVWMSIYCGAGIPVWLSFLDLISEAREDRSFVKELVSSYDIIFVDDLWSGGASAEEKSVIRELVLRCYDSKKLICYTANWGLEKWSVDERVRDRLVEMCVEIEFVGPSFRKMVL
jgi:DNA replication protein DnaC